MASCHIKYYVFHLSDLRFRGLHRNISIQEAEETYGKIRMRGLESLLAYYGMIVSVPKLQIFASLTPEECADSISRRTAAKPLLLTRRGMCLEETIEKTFGKIE